MKKCVQFPWVLIFRCNTFAFLPAKITYRNVPRFCEKKSPDSQENYESQVRIPGLMDLGVHCESLWRLLASCLATSAMALVHHQSLAVVGGIDILWSIGHLAKCTDNRYLMFHRCVSKRSQDPGDFVDMRPFFHMSAVNVCRQSMCRYEGWYRFRFSWHLAAFFVSPRLCWDRNESRTSEDPKNVCSSHVLHRLSRTFPLLEVFLAVFVAIQFLVEIITV